jgi:hypothetical protein
MYPFFMYNGATGGDPVVRGGREGGRIYCIDRATTFPQNGGFSKEAFDFHSCFSIYVSNK